MMANWDLDLTNWHGLNVQPSDGDEMLVIACADAETNDSEKMRHYIERCFVPFEALVRQSGAAEKEIAELIHGRASAGIVYSRRADGSWWSALAALMGQDEASPPFDGAHWYSPASLYWLRRASLARRKGASIAEAASGNSETFTQQFVSALELEPLAPFNYPDAFVGEALDHKAAGKIAESEWHNWTCGAYAVCLRSFTGQSCVGKESLGRALRTEFDSDQRTLTDEQVVDLVERLATLLMPFAPFERPVGTPGIAVDRVLHRLDLGHEEPYGATAN
jgi:hypothetical protein